MANTFTYRVRDKSGRVVSGALEADNATSVAARLRQMGYVPISIDKKSNSITSMNLSIGSRKVKPAELSALTRQLATMISAGLPLIRALGVLGEQANSDMGRRSILDVKADVEKGASLSQAMSKHPKAFGRLYVAMVKAGEASGALDEVLMQLADTLEKQVALRHKVRSALTYPVVVFGLVVLIASAMLLFVVPMFKKLYDRLGGTLPAPTRALLTMSEIFKTFTPVIVICVVLFVWLLRRWIRTPSGRLLFDGFKLRVPIMGDLIHKSAIARFTRTFGALLSTGVTMLDALDITADTAGNEKIAKVIRDARDQVRGGESLSKVLGESPMFPRIVIQMMAVGEETGALDELVGKISEFYESEVESKVAALTSLLEPILIVVMGGTVGSMVVSLYLPMFNIIKLVNGTSGNG